LEFEENHEFDNHPVMIDGGIADGTHHYQFTLSPEWPASSIDLPLCDAVWLIYNNFRFIFLLGLFGDSSLLGAVVKLFSQRLQTGQIVLAGYEP
jgi:hypothetical protein